MRFRTALLGVLLLVVLTAAGCGNVADDLPTVTGEFGKSATITLPKADPDGYSVTTIINGDGEVTRPGDVISIKYAGVTWPGGEDLGNSFEQDATVSVNTSTASSSPGLHEALAGKHVGSRVMVALPQTSQDETGATISQTVVLAIDILGIEFRGVSGPVTQAGAGLPLVLGQNGQKPVVTIPKTGPPTELVSHTLIEGDGAPIKKGDTLVVQYTGVIWRDGTEFDASWNTGAPGSFPIGENAVISGWDKGLVGKSIGSRVLLVVPPDDGYGAGGNEQAGIQGTDTLVFVVDLLGVAPTA